MIVVSFAAINADQLFILMDSMSYFTAFLIPKVIRVYKITNSIEETNPPCVIREATIPTLDSSNGVDGVVELDRRGVLQMCLRNAFALKHWRRLSIGEVAAN